MQKKTSRFWKPNRSNRRRKVLTILPFLVFLFPGLIHIARAQQRSAEVKPVVMIARSFVEGHREATKALSEKAEAAIPSLLECYKAELRKKRGAVGELHTEITISPKGVITEVHSLATTTADETLKSCSVKAIKKWNLEKWPLEKQVLAILNINFVLFSKAPQGTVVTGGLKENMVAGVFNGRLGEFDDCIESPPDKKTRVISTVNIAFNGRVKSATVTGRSISHKARKCMAGKILLWRFPSSHVGHRTYVQYPLFFFSSDNGEKSGKLSSSNSPGPDKKGDLH